MRVLLILPTSQYKYAYPTFLSVTDFPTGFAFIASALRDAGHEVFGLNPNSDPSYQSAHEMVYDKVSRSLHEVQPELIGLGGLCTDYKFIKDTMQIIRGLAPDIPIVCGGGIINNDAEYIFKLLKPDFCIRGEGEETIVKLADALESGEQRYDQIDNLGYWKGNEALFTKTNFDYIDVNQRAFPDYETFGAKEMIDKFSMAARGLYRYTRPYPRPMVIVTARGCPFNCSFCVHQRSSRYRARSVENILQEMALLYERYSFNVLIILDELFAVNKPRMRQFCTALLEAKEAYKWDFDWIFQTHASASLDYGTLELAKKAGCYFFSYGLESASPRVLESMNKKTKVSQIIEAIKVADKANIGFGGNFIFGDPAETKETIAETMEFFSQHCLNAYTQLGLVQPYPGSKIFEGCLERGIIKDKLKYYEKIDESAWNMTSMPDRLWLPWAYCLELLTNSFLWVKSADITDYEEEVESINNPVVAHRGLVWRVWTECPHCGKEVYCREMLGATRATGNRNTIRQSLLGIIKLLRIAVKTAFFYLLDFKHPLLKTLKSILANRDVTPFFITSCPSCNKKFKVNLPAMSKVSSLKRKLLLEFIWRVIK